MDAAFLAADLRRADPDRHLLSLFYPAPVRMPLQALFLLNHEIARTRSMVTDTNLGLIRLQWWRDEIAKIYAGKDSGQIPVLSTLAPAIGQGKLPFELFETLLFAREFDLEDVAPATFDGLRNYADFTTTPLNQLALKIVGEDAPIDEIRHISTNFGLFEVMRSVPYMLSQARCYLPQDHLTAKNLTPRKIIDFNHQKEISDIVKEISALIAPYRKPISRLLDRHQRMMLIYLKNLAKNKFDVFSADFQVPPPLLALRLALGLR
jgi:NADH dehydrogenase [ubiquinone] 1 alpha subcomplex assembly factor 6